MLSNQFDQRLTDRLTDLEERVSITSDPRERLHLINCIIQLKLILHQNSPEHIYKDLKKWIKAYCETTEVDRYGYDQIDIDIVLRRISPLPTEQKISFLKYSGRELMKIHDLENYQAIENLINRNEFKHLKEKLSLINFLKIILIYPTLNIKSLLFSFIIIFIGCNLLLLPSPSEWMETFEFSKNNYSDNFLLNHIINVLCVLFDLNPETYVKPTKPIGVILGVFFKSIFLLLVINYLFKLLTKHLRIEA